MGLVAGLLVMGCGDDDEAEAEGSFHLGGQVIGLEAEGLVLENEAGESLSLSAAETSFQFEEVYEAGQEFSVEIGEQPEGQECALDGGEGVFEEQDVMDLRVECETLADMAVFEVSVDRDDSILHVDQGQTLVLMVDVTNLGAEEGTQELAWWVDDEMVDGQEVTLDAGDEERLSFEMDVDEDAEVGNLVSTIESEDSSEVVLVTVDNARLVEVAIDHDESTLSTEAGGMLEVVVDAHGAGSQESTEDIELWIDGEMVDSEEVTLESGDSETLHFEVDSDDYELGPLYVEVASAEDRVGAAAQVITLGEPYFVVDFDRQLTPPGSMVIEVTYYVEVFNASNTAGEQEVVFEIVPDDSFYDTITRSETVSLDAGDSTQLSFEVDLADYYDSYMDYNTELHVESEDHGVTKHYDIDGGSCRGLPIGSHCEGPVVTLGRIDGDWYATTMEDLSGEYQWAQGSGDTGATSDSDGQANTSALMSESGNGAPFDAAQACDDLDEAGYDEWFLPAREQVYNGFGRSGAQVPNLEGSGYWTSTSTDGANNHIATFVNIDDVTPVGTSKTMEHAVRCMHQI